VGSAVGRSGVGRAGVGWAGGRRPASINITRPERTANRGTSVSHTATAAASIHCFDGGWSGQRGRRFQGPQKNVRPQASSTAQATAGQATSRRQNPNWLDAFAPPTDMIKLSSVDEPNNTKSSPKYHPSVQGHTAVSLNRPSAHQSTIKRANQTLVAAKSLRLRLLVSRPTPRFACLRLVSLIVLRRRPVSQ
jgi:hypothetical protein